MKKSFDPIKFYEHEAIQYDNKRWNAPAGKYIDLVHKEIIYQMNNAWSGKTILEVGIGTGRISQFLREKDAITIGIDSSLMMLKVANKNINKNIRFKDNYLINNLATSLPFKDESFDGCVCINVFSHLPDYNIVIKEISRVIKPGAFFILNIPNLVSFYLPFGLYVNKNNKSVINKVYTKWYTFYEIKKDLNNLGIEITDIKGQIHFPNKIKGILFNMLKYLDDKSRNSFIKLFCPTLFLKGIKRVDSYGVKKR